MVAILYSFRRCPYAMRGRLALKTAGLNYEHREIELKNKPKHMLEISPKGTVPVFRTEEGVVVDESFDLMMFALHENDPENWLPEPATPAYKETMDLIAFNDGPFKQALDRYKYPNRYEDGLSENWREKGEVFLARLEEKLQETSFLFGASRSLADMAIFPFIRQFAHTDLEWWESNNYPRVRAWLATLLDSAIFKEVMVKHPLYESSN